CACAGARIEGIELRIRQAIKCHGCRARTHHGDHDPGELPSRRNSGSRQHGAAKRKREREDRVLPLDHFQRGGGAAQDAHAAILGDEMRWEVKRTKYKVRSRCRWQSTVVLRTSYFSSVLRAGL